MEKHIEQFVRKQVEKMGGRCLKWVCPGNDGVPDRIILMPDGAIWFVEFKDDGYRPTELQKWWGKELDRLGQNWEIIRGMEEAKKFVMRLRSVKEKDDAIYTA